MRTAVIMIGFVMILVWTCGCGNEPYETVSLKKVQAECRKLKDDQLRKRAETYRDLIIDKLQELAKLNKRIAETVANPETATSDELEEMKAESARLVASSIALKKRYHIYIVALVRRNMDVSKLRLLSEEDKAKKQLPEIWKP